MNSRNRTLLTIAGIVVVVLVIFVGIVLINPSVGKSLADLMSGAGANKPTATPAPGGGGTSCTPAATSYTKIQCGAAQTQTTLSTPNTTADLSYCNLGTYNVSCWNFTGSVSGAVNMTGIKFNGSNITGANFAGANLTNAAFSQATGGASANVTGVTWNNTTCPDGTNSNNNGGTCVGHGF